MTTRTYNYLDADPMVYFRTGSTPSLSILYVCIHLYYTILSRHTIYIYTYIRSLISFCTGWFICSISTYIRNYAYKNPLTHTHIHIYIYMHTYTHVYIHTDTPHPHKNPNKPIRFPGLETSPRQSTEGGRLHQGLLLRLCFLFRLSS